MAAELAHRLVSRHLADATESHVVRAGEAGGPADQSQGLRASLARELRSSAAPGEVVDDGLDELQERVAVGRRDARGGRRADVRSSLVPGVLEVQLASAEVALPGSSSPTSFLSRFSFQLSRTRPTRELWRNRDAPVWLANSWVGPRGAGQRWEA